MNICKEIKLKKALINYYIQRYTIINSNKGSFTFTYRIKLDENRLYRFLQQGENYGN